MTNSLLKLDANGRPFQAMLPFLVKKTITFAGGTTNAIGDHDGTGDPFTIFNVTGDVLAIVLGICKTDLVGAATLSVGVTGNTASLLAQIADTTTFDADMVWQDASPTYSEQLATSPDVIAGGRDIIGTVGAANITAGVIDFYCFYMPLSDDGVVAPA